MLLRLACLGLLLCTVHVLPAAGHGGWRRDEDYERRPDRAAREEERTEREKKERAWHYYCEGRELWRRQHFEAAAEVLEAACDLLPREGRYHLLLGKVYREEGEAQSAITHLRLAYETGDEKVQEQSAELLLALYAPVNGPGGLSAEEPSTSPGKVSKTLYERLGGRKAIEAVVEDFVGRVMKDSRINGFFKRANLDDLKARLVELIGSASGGPEVYRGQTMKQAHKGMHIKGEDFDALVNDLAAALDRFKVPQREKDELLAILAPMRTDIVER